MKITGNFQSQINKTQEYKYNSNPFFKTQFDSVSFEGKKNDGYLKQNPARTLFKRIGAFLSALMAFGNTTGCANKAPQPTTEYVPPTTSIIETYAPESNTTENLTPTQAAVRDMLSENYFYQVAQTKDGVSLTFDYTDNHAYEVMEPESEYGYIAKNDRKGATTLSELILDSYGLEDHIDNTEVVNLIAQSIVKANPWMAEMVAPDAAFNYGDTDITHIDPALVLSTDYLAGAETTPAIKLPTVNVYVDTDNSSDSRIATSKNVEFISINRDENNLATIEFDEADIVAMRNNPSGIINYVEQRLAQEYSITSMDSYAGDAIWHGIALWEDNEEIFAQAGEDEIQDALVKYVLNNDTMEIVCPRIAVTFMVDENSSYDEHSEMFRKITTPDEYRAQPVITYLSNEVAVYEFEEGATSFRPIDVLDYINFPGGESIKELLGDNYETRKI